jgi:TATA-box binding protein (TBP) (component of TFIID and TFIIIB)
MSAQQQSITIENVVASTSIEQELDLEDVAMDLDGADYDPEKFPGLVYRTQDPKAAALIFRSGKIVCTGANSVDAVHESLDIVFGAFAGLGIPIPDDPEITVQNIVSSADLGERLNLNAIVSVSDSNRLSTNPSSSQDWSTEWTTPTLSRCCLGLARPSSQVRDGLPTPKRLSTQSTPALTN